MISALALTLLFCLYMGILFVIALKAETGSKWLSKLSTNPYVYALSFGIYCTTWTFYGSVGKSVVSGILFLAFYIGPMFAICFWGQFQRKMVRIKNTFHITSVADFISVRYNRSNLIAVCVTIFALVGVLPYIALQLKAVFVTSEMIITSCATEDLSWLISANKWITMILIVLFTIMFGARTLNPNETHKGMVLSVALQSAVQLFALLVAGVFVCFFLFDGLGDLFQSLEAGPYRKFLDTSHVDYIQWVSLLVISMAAVNFLPRQFHLTVIENADESHIRTTQWVFPLYMFLITIFVIPIAAAGIVKGLPVRDADHFVLSLPLQFGHLWLAALVFIGGLSAAASMIMICAMAIATMMTNHLLFPIINSSSRLAFLKRYILQFRWVLIATVVLLGYLFELLLGGSYMLVSMGIISFVAVLQFAPCILGGLYWRQANLKGALLGLVGGFFVWFYTLLMPALAKSGWISSSIVTDGPWGVGWLRPEHLLGLSALDSISHCVFWSLIVNCGLYIGGSIWGGRDEGEEELAAEIVDIMSGSTALAHITHQQDPTIMLEDKRVILGNVLRQYVDASEAEKLMFDCINHANLIGRSRITVLELANLRAQLEKVLAGFVGAAASHRVVKQYELFSWKESGELSSVYGDILAKLKINPVELTERINYYEEREVILERHADELREKVIALEAEIEHRTLAEHALKESEENLAITLNSIGDAVIATDNAGIIVRLNPVACELTGWEEEDAIGESLDEVLQVHDPDVQGAGVSLVKLVEDAGSYISRGRYITLQAKDGKRREITESAAPIKDTSEKMVGMVVVFRDVTESLRLEEQLRQSQKMDSIGQLAGGVAHDFNNMLCGIVGATNLLRKRVKGGKEAKYVSIIAGAAERASLLTEKLLDFSRKGKVLSQPLNVHDAIKDTFDILEHGVDRKIELQSRLEAKHSVLVGDLSQLQNAILNLSLNARDAMPDGGVLTIRTTNITLTPTSASGLSSTIIPGYYLLLEISDTGMGIPKEDMEHIFEPFFTTKEVGQGTGLGLAAVYGAIHDHHGAIDCHSKVGQGTTFSLYLPIDPEVKLEELPTVESPEHIQKNRGSVLVVDDEPVVRNMAVEMLREIGYEALGASDGPEGLVLFERHEQHLAAVLLDVVMPKMNGIEVKQRMALINSSVPVILSSGYTLDRKGVGIAQMKSIEFFIKKPYTEEALAEVLEKVAQKRKQAESKQEDEDTLNEG